MENVTSVISNIQCRSQVDLYPVGKIQGPLAFNLLVMLSTSNKYEVENFTSSLCIGAIPDMGKDRKLWNLSKCCFASILMYLEETRSKYPNASALSEIIYKAGLCDIRMSDMMGWGTLVKLKFELEN